MGFKNNFNIEITEIRHLDIAPNESCGLIAGFVDGDVKSIEKVYFLTNLDNNNVHFTMSPKEQFVACLLYTSRCV